MVLTSTELTILGAALYICEGAKARHDNRGGIQYAIDFTNSDPRVITQFLNFLRNNLPVEENRIKAQLFIYPDHDEVVLVDYWSTLTRVPVNRFNKVIHMKQ